MKEKNWLEKIKKIDPTSHLCNEWTTHNELLWESKLKFLFCPNRVSVKHLRSIEVARSALLCSSRNMGGGLQLKHKSIRNVSFTSLWFSSCRVLLSFFFTFLLSRLDSSWRQLKWPPLLPDKLLCHTLVDLFDYGKRKQKVLLILAKWKKSETKTKLKTVRLLSVRQKINWQKLTAHSLD